MKSRYASPARVLLLSALCLLAPSSPAPAAEAVTAGVAPSGDSTRGFALRDKPGESLDVLLDGKTVARYMYAHDASTPARRTETYKPYLHVFDAAGNAPITKGPGGKFPHHRGIFIGWNKITFNGKSYDRWHMPNGEIVHQKFLSTKAGPDEASFTSLTHWEGDNKTEPGKAFVEEERTMTFRRAPAPARLLIDFDAKLSAPLGDVALDGDPEHAGIHFRPADEITAKETLYVYPREQADAHKDADYPWVGETYSLGGNRYSVVEMSHPDDPKGTRWSAYRDYGRFGAFPKATIKGGQSQNFKYRFLIAEGEMPAVELIQKSWDEFAGVAAPTAAPKTTVKPAEGTKSAAKPAAK